MTNNKCVWGNFDCKHIGEKCDLCLSEDFHYAPTQKRKISTVRRSSRNTDKRRGTNFEHQNSIRNQQLLNGTISRATPNSGAGRIKGDEQISGLINIMEELKQQVKPLKGGNKSFSIQKKWLEKLHVEALREEKEFWYLKGSFGDTEDFPFIVIEPDIIMSMVYTMSEDRRDKIRVELEKEVLEKQRAVYQSEASKNLAEIELLKSEKKLLEMKLEDYKKKFGEIK